MLELTSKVLPKGNMVLCKLSTIGFLSTNVTAQIFIIQVNMLHNYTQNKTDVYILLYYFDILKLLYYFHV